MLLPVLVACINPVTFGAVPDDHQLDTDAIQRAIDAAPDHGEVCLGPGVWELGAPPREGKHGRIGSIIIRNSVTIRGAGPSTILRLTGDGERRDWRGLQLLGAHDVVLADFTIDGLGAFDTEEQTHLIEVGPDSRDVTISSLVVGPMRTTTQKIGAGIGGDGIRLIGNPGHEVEDVVISDSKFVDCDRSGIGIQRSLRRIAILRDTITGAGDQSIDFEPTGRGEIEDVSIIGAIIDKPPDSQGSWAMTIVGTGRDLAHGIVVADSQIDGGGVLVMNVRDVTFDRDRIVGGLKTGDGVIQIQRRANDVQVSRSTVTRPPNAHPGAVIKATHNNGMFPRGLSIVASTLDQASVGPVIEASSIVGLELVDSTVTNHGATPIDVVHLEAVAGDVGDLRVARNHITGPIDALVALASREHRVDRVTVVANRLDDAPAAAVRCKGANSSYGAVTIDGTRGAVFGCKMDAPKRETAPSTSPAPSGHAATTTAP